jgi:uncharacterized protein
MGWRAVIYLALMAAFESAAGPVIDLEHRVFGAGDTPGGWLLEKTVLFAFLVAAVSIIGRLEGKSLAVYGLPLRRAFGRDYWAGALLGFGLLTVNIGILAVIGTYSFGRLALTGAEILGYGALWAAAVTMVGLAEEFGLRGYLQYTLSRGVGFWPAACITSALFGLAHLDIRGEPWTAVASIALGGLFFCLALRRTGNLWFPVGAHAAWDWGLSFLYSTNPAARGHLFFPSLHGSKWLTGGDAGPEGNALMAVLLCVGMGIVLCAYPAVKYDPNS